MHPLKRSRKFSMFLLAALEGHDQGGTGRGQGSVLHVHVYHPCQVEDHNPMLWWGKRIIGVILGMVRPPCYHTALLRACLVAGLVTEVWAAHCFAEPTAQRREA